MHSSAADSFRSALLKACASQHLKSIRKVGLPQRKGLGDSRVFRGVAGKSPALATQAMTSPLVRPFVILVLMAPLAACVREQRHQLYACNSGPAATAAHVI